MMRRDDLTELQSLHARLVDALEHLDRAGLYLPAAHLGNAIELLENDIDLEPASRRDIDTGGPVAVVARAMIDMFGERAQAVARRQLAEASGPAILGWATILNTMCRID